jgi:hypothetical protein
MENIHFRAKIKEIQAKLMTGVCTNEQAKKEAQPYIDEMNNKGKKIAAEHGRKHKDFTFGYLMR